MLIDEFHKVAKTTNGGKDKEIKVKIPLDHHIRLHTVKVVNGQPISSTVKAALKYYFDELRAEMDAEQNGTPGEIPLDR